MILNRKLDNKIGIRINPDYDVKKNTSQKS